MDSVLAIASAYAIGSIVWAIVLGKLLFGRDLRKTDNPGASGAVRTFGPLFGVAVGILDVLKGVLAVNVARWLEVPELVVALAAGAAVAGHNWPVWFKFSGGGGLATSAGVLSVFGLRETLIGVAVVLGFALIYKLPLLYGKLPMAALPFGSLFGLPTMIWLFRRSDSFGGVVTATLCVILVGVRALGLNAEGSHRQAARGVAHQG